MLMHDLPQLRTHLVIVLMHRPSPGRSVVTTFLSLPQPGIEVAHHDYTVPAAAVVHEIIDNFECVGRKWRRLAPKMRHVRDDNVELARQVRGQLNPRKPASSEAQARPVARIRH
jgi:hypothetical protein